MDTFENCRNSSAVKKFIAESGVSVAEWARANGFSSGLVYQVLDGRRKCVRGQSHRIALALGLKQGRLIDVETLSRVLANRAATNNIEGNNVPKIGRAHV